jgi:hypothetical protein
MAGWPCLRCAAPGPIGPQPDGRADNASCVICVSPSGYPEVVIVSAGKHGWLAELFQQHRVDGINMNPNFSRRSFLGATASGAALSVASIAPLAAQRQKPLKGLAAVSLDINGQTHSLAVDAHVTSRRVARPYRIDRHEEGLRSRTMRGLHGAH